MSGEADMASERRNRSMDTPGGDGATAVSVAPDATPYGHVWLAHVFNLIVHLRKHGSDVKLDDATREGPESAVGSATEEADADVRKGSLRQMPVQDPPAPDTPAQDPPGESRAAHASGQMQSMARNVAAAREDYDIPEPVDTQKVYSGPGYISTQLSILVARYANARGDLLVSAAALPLSDDPVLLAYTARVVEYLTSAKVELESRAPNLPVVSNLLSLAERSIIWLYPHGILRDRCEAIKADLEELTPVPRALLERLAAALESLAADHPDKEARAGRALTDGLALLHELSETSLIEDNLQVRRLRKLHWYLGVSLALVLAVAAITVPSSEGASVVSPAFAQSLGIGSEWLVLIGALALAAVGAVGGIVSGMLRVRDSRARLAEYRTSLLILSLRPLIGAVAAVSLYLLLSWDTIVGISVENPGTLLLVAFVAGFSERYFLSILRREDARYHDDKDKVVVA